MNVSSYETFSSKLFLASSKHAFLKSSSDLAPSLPIFSARFTGQTCYGKQDTINQYIQQGPKLHQ